MKRLTSLLLLIVFTVIPFVSVSAFEITCDEGVQEFEDFFTCRLTGATVGENYDILSGTITSNDYVSCLKYEDGDGLTSQATEDNRSFSYKGKPTTTTISAFRCQVIKKAEEDERVQIFINDFLAHTTSQIETATEQIVRSNYINVAKYVEKTTTSSTKPRDTSNSNSRLKALADDNLNITFSGFITEYNAEVLYEVENLDLKILPFNSDATVRIVGSQNLNVGLNVIDIYVTSPDGASITCYTLNVTRLEEGQTVYYSESDSSLKNLTVTGFSIGFKPEISEYTIHLDNQTSKVEVNATPNVDTATVNISDTNNLTNGSVISVTITSEDLSSETKYKIKITKDLPKKDYTSYIILGVLAFLGIVVIGVIIHTNKKNKKDPLLRLKNDKRKINKGKKVDQNAIPVAESGLPIQNNNAEQTNPNGTSQTAPNVIKADSVNVVEPMQITEKVADPNLNKISTNTNSIDLSVSAKAMPQAVQNQAITPQQPASTIQPALETMPQQPIANQVPIMPQQPMPQAPIQQVEQVVPQNIVVQEPISTPIEPQPIVGQVPQPQTPPMLGTQMVGQIPQPPIVEQQPINMQPVSGIIPNQMSTAQTIVTQQPVGDNISLQQPIQPTVVPNPMQVVQPVQPVQPMPQPVNQVMQNPAGQVIQTPMGMVNPQNTPIEPQNFNNGTNNQ